MMVSTIAIFFVASFTLFSTNLFNFAESEFVGRQSNLTNPGWISKSDRSKRSPTNRVPSQLKIWIEYGTELKIELNLYIKTDQSLANKYLPVIMPRIDEDLQVMEKIGMFIFFHNTRHCSSVVYFQNLNSLYGVIGTDYSIVALPFDFDENGEYRSGVVSEPYIQKRQHLSPHIFPEMVPPSPSDTDAWRDYVRTPNKDLKSQKRPAQCDHGPVAKIPRIDHHDDDNIEERIAAARMQLNEVMHAKKDNMKSQEYYFETLVLVTHDLAEIFEQQYGRDDYIGWIVRHHIIYFNAVDTIFQKFQLAKIGFHINIAKIVIEDILFSPFDFARNSHLQYHEVIRKLPKYLNSHSGEYPIDSFDHVFISTSHAIFDDDFMVEGITKYGADLYEARKRNEFYNVVPISIVRLKNFYVDYAVGVHNIARTLNMKVDPHENGLTSTGQCHGIMQREGAKCINCLKWSDDSRNQYKSFFTENKNRCFQLNSPRSLRPPGISRFTTTTRQCQCFGYDSTVSPRDVGIGGCKIPLKCEKNSHGRLYREDSVQPFDGTTCTGRKVCWNGECVLATTN